MRYGQAAGLGRGRSLPHRPGNRSLTPSHREVSSSDARFV
jgi:hypothetical protein